MRLVQKKYSISKINNNDLDTLTTNQVNEYCPIYTILNSKSDLNDEFICSTEVTDKVFSYCKPTAKNKNTYSHEFQTSKSINTLLNAFTSYTGSVTHKYKVGEIQHILNVSGGCILDKKGKILMLLAAKSSCLGPNYENRGINIIDNDYNLNVKNIRLFVSTDFFKYEQYKNIYKRLEKEIIQNCYAQNIEVLFTTSEDIENQVFKSNLIFNFTSIEEMNTHLEKVIEILTFEEEIIEELPRPDILRDYENFVLYPVTAITENEIVEENNNEVVQSRDY